jgi:uncharacterized protein (TIGR02145 family)
MWQNENLAISVFNNGDSIPFANNEKEWRIAGLAQKPCYTYLKNKYGDVILPHTYIYNWFVISDKRGIAPAGYRLPTNSDIWELISFCGGVCETAKKLKSKFGWDQNDLTLPANKIEKGLDEFGLSIEPIPLILPTGLQNSCYLSSGFWTSEESKNGVEIKDFLEDFPYNLYEGHMAYCFNLTFKDCMNYQNLFFKEGGLPIRCIYNDSTRNSEKYPIPILSNTNENISLEKVKHLESLCPSCFRLPINIDNLKNSYVFKEVYVSDINIRKYEFYFDQKKQYTIDQRAGIGLSLGVKNNEIIVDEIIKGGPCDQLNILKKKDILIGIYENNKLYKFQNLSIENVINKIKGQENTIVRLLVKSNVTLKEFELDIIRGKIPNWDLKKLLNQSNINSAWPTLLDNEYFFYKYNLLPANHKYPIGSPLGYIYSKATLLYYCGPYIYRINHDLGYPSVEWNLDDLIAGTEQIVTQFRGGSEFNPIVLKSIDDARKLFLTFGFEIANTFKLENEVNITKIIFKHLTRNEFENLIVYFNFN